ncbi:hypothetical protein G6F63_015983 [Rhizopus arrhizus]|nr:hypothetical protein G6F63_015983 [Rhizopus arrhizus]
MATIDRQRHSHIAINQLDQVITGTNCDHAVAGNRHRLQHNSVVALARVTRQRAAQVAVQQADQVVAQASRDRGVTTHPHGVQQNDVVAVAGLHRHRRSRSWSRSRPR